MNWQRWLAGIVLLALAGTAIAPLAGLMPPAILALAADSPAWESCAVDADPDFIAQASTADTRFESCLADWKDEEAGDAVPGEHALAWGWIPYDGVVDHAFGDVFRHYDVPAFPHFHAASGAPWPQGFAGDPPGKSTHGVAGWSPSYGVPSQYAQWPYSPDTNTPRDAPRFFVSDSPEGDPPQVSLVDLPPELTPPADQLPSIDEQPCQPSCNGGPSPSQLSAIPEPGLLWLLGAGTLAFAAVRRKAGSARRAPEV